MRNVAVLFLLAQCAYAMAAPAAAADLPNAPASFPALTPSAADVAPDPWAGLYVGSGVSAWGGKGVKGGFGGETYLGYDHVFDNGVVLGVRASTGYMPFLWSNAQSTQFSGSAFAGGEATVGYNFGQVTPYVVTGVDFIRPTNFGGGALNASNAINSVFAGPGAVQAVGTVGIGVNYQITPNFSMGLEARVFSPGYGAGPWP
jgi:opacity protein-like surface antigen